MHQMKAAQLQQRREKKNLNEKKNAQFHQANEKVLERAQQTQNEHQTYWLCQYVQFVEQC